VLLEAQSVVDDAVSVFCLWAMTNRRRAHCRAGIAPASGGACLSYTCSTACRRTGAAVGTGATGANAPATQSITRS
jgi:hypothetical protein